MEYYFITHSVKYTNHAAIWAISLHISCIVSLAILTCLDWAYIEVSTLGEHIFKGLMFPILDYQISVPYQIVFRLLTDVILDCA